MELLKRFKHGEVDAFEILFRQFQADVYGWIVQIVRDPGIAEDLTIETFWGIYRARARFDDDASFGASSAPGTGYHPPNTRSSGGNRSRPSVTSRARSSRARAIARNLAIDHIRGRRR